MSENMILSLSVLCWIMGFFSAWMYGTLKIKYLTVQNQNLKKALELAGHTIIEQGIEIHGILTHAQKCESELIN